MQNLLDLLASRKKGRLGIGFGCIEERLDGIEWLLWENRWQSQNGWV